MHKKGKKWLGDSATVPNAEGLGDARYQMSDVSQRGLGADVRGQMSDVSRQGLRGQVGGALGQAIGIWAEQSTRASTLERERRLSDKSRVISEFFGFAGCEPPEVTPGQVLAWQQEMKRRGLAVATIYQRCCLLGAFFDWLRRTPQLADVIRGNPVSAVRPRCPQPYQSRKTKALSDEELNRLVGLAQARAESGGVRQKRDYALLLFYLLTGLRRREVSDLAGRDIKFTDDGGLQVKYRRKGGEMLVRQVSEPLLAEAIKDYLVAGGRWNAVGTARPLWIRCAGYEKQEMGLCDKTFVLALKELAKSVGIEPINLHQTRHTFARIVAEAGGSLELAKEALDHSHLTTTRHYVKRLTVKPDKSSKLIVGKIMGIRDKGQG